MKTSGQFASERIGNVPTMKLGVFAAFVIGFYLGGLCFCMAIGEAVDIPLGRNFAQSWDWPNQVYQLLAGTWS